MVDRIGKGGAPPPTHSTGPTGTSRPTETGKAFEVEKPAATAEAQAVQPVNPALAQLKAGQIDFNRYLDMKVDEATRHLGSLSKVELDSIRSMLRDRLATDPELVDLVKQATGRVPSTDE